MLHQHHVTSIIGIYKSNVTSASCYINHRHLQKQCYISIMLHQSSASTKAMLHQHHVTSIIGIYKSNVTSASCYINHRHLQKQCYIHIIHIVLHKIVFLTKRHAARSVLCNDYFSTVTFTYVLIFCFLLKIFVCSKITLYNIHYIPYYILTAKQCFSRHYKIYGHLNVSLRIS